MRDSTVVWSLDACSGSGSGTTIRSSTKTENRAPECLLVPVLLSRSSAKCDDELHEHESDRPFGALQDCRASRGIVHEMTITSTRIDTWRRLAVDVTAAETPTARSVLIIGSEAVPFAKTGGLADVLGVLPIALAGLGWSATLVLPRYRGVTAGSWSSIFRSASAPTRATSASTRRRSPTARSAILVDCPDLFDRDALYGVDGADYPDSPRRSALLARAALEFAGRRESGPSVVHAHDWQAGLTPVYLRTLYASHPLLGDKPCVFTIHNLAYQGLCEPDWLPRLDLPWELFAVDQLEFWGRISLLKGGIWTAKSGHPVVLYFTSFSYVFVLPTCPLQLACAGRPVTTRPQRVHGSGNGGEDIIGGDGRAHAAP